MYPAAVWTAGKRTAGTVPGTKKELPSLLTQIHPTTHPLSLNTDIQGGSFNLKYGTNKFKINLKLKWKGRKRFTVHPQTDS